MNLINDFRKIGVFYDGNFLLHASNYYNYSHPQRSRISLGGLHDFICKSVASEERVDPAGCYIAEAHYFRGRLNASDAAQRGNQLYNDRVFDDILMSAGVHPHYLPLRNMQGRREERGIDVWLSLEAYELSLSRSFDIVALIVADTDYVPLLRKLRTLGVRVMLLSWEFEYTSDDGTRMVTRTSHELMQLASYHLPMHDIIDRGLKKNDPLITGLFVVSDMPQRITEPEMDFNVSTVPAGSADVSEILSLKNCFGFVKYPNNNLFFHSQDVIEGDFGDLIPGDRVEFTIEKNDLGQDVAKNVRKLSE